MVIGDGWNDLPMFRIAGHAIAMQGAPDELLALATTVVPAIENDGAAVAIDQYVLNA
jgi:hydroxymethylpyrimidine pyrophosphatase-like HAD family hydrolase